MVSKVIKAGQWSGVMGDVLKSGFGEKFGTEAAEGLGAARIMSSLR
jgi:hypothetical protein